VRKKAQLRVEIFIEQEQVADDHLTGSTLADLGDKHLRMVEDAIEGGKRWAVIITDPDGDLTPVAFGNPDALPGVVLVVRETPAGAPWN